MELFARRLLTRVILASLLIVCGLCTLNILVDPYELFDAPTVKYLNAHKPTSVLTLHERQIKSYELRREKVHGVILGTSMVDVGLDAESPAWPASAAPMYNLGFFGIDLNGSSRYLRYVLQHNRLSLVVVGVEFDQFLGRGVDPLNERDWERLGNIPMNLRARDLAQAALSFDATVDSLDTLVNNLLTNPPGSTSGNHPADEFARSGYLVGSTTVFRVADVVNMSISTKKEKFASTLNDFYAVLELCHENGVTVIVVINPIYVDMLETYSLFGYWEEFENWKRDLVSIVSRAADGKGGGAVELWDFSGYDQYSTVDPQHATRWFWNPTHYTRQLGDLLVRRLFGSGDPSFGAILTPQTIEARLYSIRKSQEQYRASHVSTVASLRHLYLQVVPLSGG